MSPATPERTLEQKRAEEALGNIRELAQIDPGHYVSYVSSLPATIVSSGLGQALATLLAKAKNQPMEPHRILYDHLAAWLAEQIPELAGPPEQVIDKLMANDENVYLRAQGEALAYLHWLKQFARAYLREPEGRE